MTEEREGFEGADLVTEDRAYIAANDRERARMRDLVEHLDDVALRTPVNDHWNVAAVLAHIAFWDGRMLALAQKMDRGVPFDESDAGPLCHAIPPLEAVTLALTIAEETDARAASIPLDRVWPTDPASPLYPVRADHRGEHLDDVAAALGR
jgi:hypothetical protein